MKLKKIFSITTVCLNFFIIGCSFSADQNLIHSNKWDFKNIPDKYNTGPKEEIQFNKLSQTGEIAEGVTLLLRTDTKTPFYCLTSRRTSLPDSVTVRNYDFSDYDFSTLGMDQFKRNKKITFENCKFKGFRNDAVAPGSTKVYFVFNHCSFEGGVNSAYITLNDCKVGGFTSDGMNPLREFYANNLYIYDLSHEGNKNGSHIDGIQIYGDQSSRKNVVNNKWIPNLETGKISFKNVRFEIPSIYYEGNTSYVNACVMFQLEFSDVDDVSFEDLYVNGGGKWFPIYLDHGKNNDRSLWGAWSHKNLVMKNVMVSNNFGKIFYPDLLEDARIQDVDHHDYLFVTSVWKDDKGTAHLIVTNDTKSDKTLIVKTDVGTIEFLVPHCPSNWALGGELNSQVETNEGLKDNNGREYKTYRWKDMPFDLDYTIKGNPSFVLCYQNDEQIRYVSFDGLSHSYNEIK